MEKQKLITLKELGLIVDSQAASLPMDLEPRKPLEDVGKASSGVFLDSSLFVALYKRNLKLSELAEVTEDAPVALDAITAAELLQMLEATETHQVQVPKHLIQSLLELVPIVPFDMGAAKAYASVYAQLTRDGEHMSPKDLMLGSIAVAHGYDILTDDPRELWRMPGLRVKLPNW